MTCMPFFANTVVYIKKNQRKINLQFSSFTLVKQEKEKTILPNKYLPNLIYL